MTAWYQFPISHGYYTEYDPRVSDTPHQAVDIATPFHTPITAFKSGKVVQADYAPWGGEVFIQPDDGSTEYYFYHFDENDVVTGQHVNAGQTLGLSGGQNSGGMHPVPNTNYSTGPHTHVGFFTGWESTPIGTRSVGPDITPTIKNLAIGGIQPDTSTSTQNVLGYTVPSTHTIGVNIGMFLVGIVIVVAGALFLFHMHEVKHVV